MKNADAFSSFHPALLCLAYVLILALSMFLTHPLCLAVSLLGAFFYAASLRGGRALVRSLGGCLAVALLAAGVNVLFQHEGATILTYFSSGNPLTLESIAYGLSSGLLLTAVLLWFGTYQRVMSSDKFVYLFGRLIPALSLALSMTLRFVPRFQAQLRAVQQARAFSGGQEKSGPMQKIRIFVENFSILVTWSLENAVETADSMRARGYGLPGRTSFSIFRFDPRDRWMLLWLLGCGGVVGFGWAAGAFFWRYYPTVRGSFGPATWICAAAELLLALTPWIVDRWEARRWNS